MVEQLRRIQRWQKRRKKALNGLDPILRHPPGDVFFLQKNSSKF